MVNTVHSDIDEKVAIVTGASSGIGEATAHTLATLGASVVLAARRKTELEALAKEIESNGGEALVVQTDVSHEEDIDELIETTLSKFGHIDILVNNAGVMLLERIDQASRDNFQQMVDVNLLGVMNLIHATLPHMQNQEGGHIVNISSAAGRRTSPKSSVYNATKFGVNAFTDALRKEVTTEGIRTTLIEPGIVDTELQEHIPDEEVKEQLNERINDSMAPLKSEDIANAIAYAVSQPAHVNLNEMLIRPTDQIR